MARYHAQVQGTTAIAVDTEVCWIMSTSATNGFKLRRVTASLVAAGSAAAPPDQQCVLGINRVTTAGTTPVAGTVAKLDPNTLAATAAFDTAFTGAPTKSAADDYRISISSRGGADLYWEGVEEFVVSAGTTSGLAFVNRVNALTSPLAWIVDVEWEE
jgi:hypothetical protein